MSVHLGNFSSEESVTYSSITGVSLDEIEALVKRARAKGASDSARFRLEGHRVSFSWLTEHAFIDGGVRP